MIDTLLCIFACSFFDEKKQRKMLIILQITIIVFLILQSVCLQNSFRIHCRMALLSLQDGESVITVLVEEEILVTGSKERRGNMFYSIPVIGYE
jgi:low affinity Fe/Cu permease